MDQTVTQTTRDQNDRHERSQFAVSLPLVVAIGSVLTAALYGLILAGPLDFPILRRYCFCHPVAYATVWLYFIGTTELAIKWLRARHQVRIERRASVVLRRLVDEGKSVSPAGRVDWLLASWQVEPGAVCRSWLGNRVTQTLRVQQSRGRRHQVDSDLKSLSDADGDQQYESYALVRIIHWAMPMLGFLGTVVGLSVTLSQLDMQKLVSQDQAAMNQLTGGLYVAFDTTALALVLTIASMFVQFAVSRIESQLLDHINHDTERTLIGFLSVDPFSANDTLLEPVREMASELIGCVRELVLEQANLWSRSIRESQQQWTQWTDRLANEVELQSAHALSESLSKHLAGFETLQEKSAAQLEGRLQQWQTTLSEQTRALHSHQKEVTQQTATLNQLVESTVELRKLEEAQGNNVVQKSIEQVEQLEHAAARIQQATECVVEAVAKLAVSLERSGVVRSAPQKPRPAVAALAKNVDRTNSQEHDSEDILPFDAKHTDNLEPDQSNRKGKAA